MPLSNIATPKYYGEFRRQVLAGKIPVNQEIAMEMNRIDYLIKDPQFYYDPDPVEGYIRFCEHELTLTDGSDLVLLDSFKLWAEQVFGWYIFIDRSVPVPSPSGKGVVYERRSIKKRLINKQYLIVGRGAAKSMYDSSIHSYYLNVDTSTTYQMTTAPTMRQADEIMSRKVTSMPFDFQFRKSMGQYPEINHDELGFPENSRIRKTL